MNEVELTPERLAEVRARLARVVGENDASLQKAKSALESGALADARLDMAEAIRAHAARLRVYDTTGRLAAQAQELNHLRTKLLKGATHEASKALFKRLNEIGQTSGSGLDEKIVKGVGNVARGIAAGAWALVKSGVAEPSTMTTVAVSGVLGGAARLYSPIKTAVKALHDGEARQAMRTAYRSIRVRASDIAGKAWSRAKETVRTAAETTMRKTASGYAFARETASRAAAFVREKAESALTAIVRGARMFWNFLTA